MASGCRRPSRSLPAFADLIPKPLNATADLRSIKADPALRTSPVSPLDVDFAHAQLAQRQLDTTAAALARHSLYDSRRGASAAQQVVALSLLCRADGVPVVIFD